MNIIERMGAKKVEGFQKGLETKWAYLKSKNNQVDEIEFFYTCEACGQSLDVRELGQVFYHHVGGHEPIRADA
ncbi:hypothetical protein KAR91_83345 [Candidatus Pacearchaeota archaeon]|nr:hypothetical protein [Candidatus Pacearchaeota archaeon]